MLLAPTGRAAKIMSQYSGRQAFTIHKRVFQQNTDPESGQWQFSRQKNYHHKTVFIVDEASMLQDNANYGQSSILADLLAYVFENGDNKLILIGDTAQLPPVGESESPALSGAFLSGKHQLKVWEYELTEVMRQDAGSGILLNATHLRDTIRKNALHIQFKTNGYPDVYKMTGEKLEEGLRYAYDKFGNEGTIIVCRSNKAAVMYNAYIRRQIYFYEEEIDAGDVIMVVKNNYHFLSKDAASGFIANGDFAEVRKIVSLEENYGFRFATLSLQLVDYPDSPPFEAKVHLETLHSNAPSLDAERHKQLYEAVRQDYADITTKKGLREALAQDDYLQALQIKFAYALTCHKAQGGQWEAVFVDQGYFTSDMLDAAYLRWLYTAVTRASKELYLLNFQPNFF